MNIKHHPDEATLISYVAGTLPEALSAVVASHISMCEHCRSEVQLLQEVGGLMVDTVDPVELKQVSMSNALEQFDSLMARIDKQEQVSSNNVHHLHQHPNAAKTQIKKDDILPEPIARALGMSIDEIPWKFMAPGMRFYKIPLSTHSEGDLRLLKIKPGYSLPEHGHGGSEMTLVLQGSYQDDLGMYQRGDIEDVDDEVEHQPIITGDQDCICLVAFEKQARFKGIGPRILQPLIGM